jgi:hypothetical protein
MTDSEKERFLRKGAAYRAWRRLERAHPGEFWQYANEEYTKLAERYAEGEAIMSAIDKHVRETER